MILRPYQSDMITSMRDHLLAGRKSVLCVSPTGSGKTVLTAHMIAAAVAKGKYAWFTVHRTELVRQSVAALEKAGLKVGVIAAGYASNGYLPAQVASIQTLFRRWRQYRAPDLLVIDETHHVCSKSWSALVRELRAVNPAMCIIGLTATPTRLDGRGLGEWFEVMVQGPPTMQLISEKFLSPYKLFAPSTANLNGVHMTAGDYNKAELDDAMRHSIVVGDAVREYKQHCAGKRAIMYLWSVRASEQMAETLNLAGIPAAHIDGKTPDQERALAGANFRDGRIKVLTNVEIVTEGFDLPAIEACFLLRPTLSPGLYLQMVGRALRAYPGKEHALIMDHCGLAFRHGLPDDPREWTLDGISKAERKPQAAPVRQCLKCYAVMPAQAAKCRECGFEFVIQERQVEQQAGELQETDATMVAKTRRQEQRTANSYEALLLIERQRGYKAGWARHVYESRQRRTGGI